MHLIIHYFFVTALCLSTFELLHKNYSVYHIRKFIRFSDKKNEQQTNTRLKLKYAFH